MRCHALSSTRKFNHHWQSGGQSLPPWWTMGVYNGEEYYLAPFYKWPNMSSIVTRGVMRYIDTTLYDALMIPATTVTRTGDVYISDEYALIPSIGIKAEASFDLYFYKNNLRAKKTCNISGEEEIPLVIPVYDFVLMRAENDDGVLLMDIRTMAEEFAAYIPSSPIMPEGFVPNVQTIALPPIYNGTPEVYNYYSGSGVNAAKVRRGIEKHFHVNASNSEWLDVTRVRWGEISQTATGTYPPIGLQSLLTTSQGSLNYQRNLESVSPYNGQCMPTQVEPPTKYNFYINPDVITGANYGMASYFSASHSQNIETYTFEIDNTIYTKTYTNLYNGCLSPYNFQYCWNQNSENYTYMYMSRLKRFILQRMVLNG